MIPIRIFVSSVQKEFAEGARRSATTCAAMR